MCLYGRELSSNIYFDESNSEVLSNFTASHTFSITKTWFNGVTLKIKNLALQQVKNIPPFILIFF